MNRQHRKTWKKIPLPLCCYDSLVRNIRQKITQAENTGCEIPVNSGYCLIDKLRDSVRSTVFKKSDIYINMYQSWCERNAAKKKPTCSCSVLLENKVIGSKAFCCSLSFQHQRNIQNSSILCLSITLSWCESYLSCSNIILN